MKGWSSYIPIIKYVNYVRNCWTKHKSNAKFSDVAFTVISSMTELSKLSFYRKYNGHI